MTVHALCVSRPGKESGPLDARGLPQTVLNRSVTSAERKGKEIAAMLWAEGSLENTCPFSRLEIPGYVIHGELGRGGMARVYLATQTSLERRVALKVLLPSWSTDELARRRFLKEGRIVAGLDHPHIVTVSDTGVFDQWYYMAMEYIAGGDLTDLIRKQVPVAHWFDIVKQVATTLEYAHTQGLVHRDVKPGNILFKNDRTVVLADFGIAKFLGPQSHLTMVGSTPGTPSYMSPEQVAGKATDFRSDLYSLGIVIYEMLTGRKPFSADSAFAIGMQHLNAPIPELPKDLARYQPVVEKLLAKNPGDRFGSAGQLLKALENVQAPAFTGSVSTQHLRSVVAPDMFPGRETLAGASEPPREGSSMVSKKRWVAPLLGCGLPFLSWIGPMLAVSTAFSNLPSWWDPQSRVEPQTVARAVPVEPSRHREEPTAVFAEPARTAQKAPRSAAVLAMPAEGRGTAPAQATLARPQANKREENKRALSRRRELQTLTAGAEPQRAAPGNAKPADGNAIHTALRAPESEPANPRARQRLHEPGEPFNRSARQSQQRQAKRSPSLRDLGDKAVPDHNERPTRKEPVSRPPADEQQQVKLTALIARAERQLEAFQLSRPRGDNAYESYRAALEIAPNDERALSGMRRMADRYAILARNRMKSGGLRVSQKLIERGLSVISDHPGLLALNRDVKAQLTEQRRREHVERLLDKADEQISQGRMIAPPGDNAWETYQELLRRNPQTMRARGRLKRGLYRVADHYEALARARVREGDLVQGKKFVEEGLHVVSYHLQLRSLRNALNSGILGAFRSTH